MATTTSKQNETQGDSAGNQTGWEAQCQTPDVVRTGRLNGLANEKIGNRWLDGNGEQVMGEAQPEGTYWDNEQRGT